MRSALQRLPAGHLSPSSFSMLVACKTRFSWCSETCECSSDSSAWMPADSYRCEGGEVREVVVRRARGCPPPRPQ